jgi:hypothetical protein
VNGRSREGMNLNFRLFEGEVVRLSRSARGSSQLRAPSARGHSDSLNLPRTLEPFKAQIVVCVDGALLLTCVI